MKAFGLRMKNSPDTALDEIRLYCRDIQPWTECIGKRQECVMEFTSTDRLWIPDRKRGTRRHQTPPKTCLEDSDPNLAESKIAMTASKFGAMRRGRIQARVEERIRPTTMSQAFREHGPTVIYSGVGGHARLDLLEVAW